MHESMDYFWAKKREVNGQFMWLPLVQHLEDTKNIAGLLWEHWLGDGQKKLVETSLTSALPMEDAGKRLLQFLAAVHDLGKATPAFQTQKGYANSVDLDIQLLEKLERVGFDGISSLRLENPKLTPHALAGQYLLASYGVRDDIATIIGGHHGKPLDVYSEGESLRACPSNYFQHEKQDSTIRQKWQNAQQQLLNWALETSGFSSVQALPTIKQPAQVILSGLLIMADWIASNETYFPLIDVEDKEIHNKQERLVQGFRKWKQVGLWTPNLQATEQLFNQRFGFKPREVQKILSETILQTQSPGIFILEAPMGVGKTEAALAAAEQLAAKTGRNGLYFGLPTQATSNGIFPRIENWLEKISQNAGDRVSIQLVHGKAALNQAYADLPRANNINIDDFNNGNVVVNAWFSGRKTAALDDFVVGTVDQFLMVALKQKHLALRHLGFSKKVVIIDEVHAYDAYMNQYLLEAITWMGAYDVPVIILSATLPSGRREALVKSYLKGKGKIFNKEERKLFSERLQTSAYPLITYTDGLETKQIKEFPKETHREIMIHRLSEENLEHLIGDLLKSGGVVGLIVNTVKRAQLIAKNLAEKFGEDQVILLHSGFIATERIRKEQELLRTIGKGAERPYQKIIVGTQVIEQSLDIDFDVLISDLAPMDLLIQRVGRLQRHEIERPNQHRQANFYVLGTSEALEFESGSSAVYGDYLLTRTQYFLPERLQIPDDISVLVQKVYADEEILFEDDAQKEKYERAKREHENKLKQQQSKAKAYRIEDPVLVEKGRRKANLIGWITNVIPEDSEEKAYAQVRDIEETIEVIALKQMEEGYGLFGQTEAISDRIMEAKIAQEVAQATLRLPQSLSKSYNIDQTIHELETYNNQYLSGWRQTSWLKGALGIIFDHNNEFVFLNKKLCYNEKYGISIEEVDTDG